MSNKETELNSIVVSAKELCGIERAIVLHALDSAQLILNKSFFEAKDEYLALPEVNRRSWLKHQLSLQLRELRGITNLRDVREAHDVDVSEHFIWVLDEIQRLADDAFSEAFSTVIDIQESMIISKPVKVIIESPQYSPSIGYLTKSEKAIEMDVKCNVTGRSKYLFGLKGNKWGGEVSYIDTPPPHPPVIHSIEFKPSEEGDFFELSYVESNISYTVEPEKIIIK